MAQDVAINAKSYTSLYSQLTQETKNKAIAHGHLCFISTNKNAVSYFIHTVDYNGFMTTKLECYKEKDLSNPKPIRFELVDGLHRVKVLEKYRGARYSSHIGTGLEIALGEGQNKATRTLLNAIDKKEELTVDKDVISDAVDELLTDDEIANTVGELLDQAEKTPGMFKKATQGMVKWLHKHFHYMKEYKGTPFVDEYKKYPIIQLKLNTVEELRGLLSLLSLKIDKIPSEKPLLVLTIEDDINLETLTENDNALLKKLFTPVSPFDKDMRSYFEKNSKHMNYLVKSSDKWPHIKTSAAQKFWFTIEEKCEDFDFERMLPKIFIGTVIVLAVVYGKPFVEAVQQHAPGVEALREKLGLKAKN